MSRIDDLIKQHCPDGVEYTTLGKLCTLSRGRVMSKDYLRDNAGDYPVYSSQTANNGIFGKINTYDQDGTFITWTTDGAHAGSVFYHDNKKFSITNVCGLISNNSPEVINIKFLYYVLNITAKGYVYSGMGNSKLMNNIMSTIKIPIPPLPVQLEIVDILDKFTKLEAELEAELEARQQQYTHYRDELLSFNVNQVKFLPMGEIGTFVRGNGLQKKDFTESGIGCIHYGQIHTYYGTYTSKTKTFVSPELASSLKHVETGDIIIAVTSENLEGVCKCVAWLGHEKIVTGGHAMIFKHNENPKYISYYLQTHVFFNQKILYARGAKVIDISKKDIEKIKIPVPPIKTQEHIVSILDKFDALVNDISSGLPAEITDRRQQYEHYRNKLLTFQEGV